MLYLLDANVLITAHNSYYPIERVPEFWHWLSYVGSQDRAKIPIEIYEEISGGKDALSAWAKEAENKDALQFDEEVDVGLVSLATEAGYANDLTDQEIEQVGRDPFLVAYALAAPDERCIVTTEVFRPTRTRANRHLPDVCLDLSVACIDSFAFLRALDFSTSWDS